MEPTTLEDPADPRLPLAGEPRTVRKRRQIIQAATTAFLRNGYRGTSMDEIAALAGVSKQTLYKHFADKANLFTEMVSATVGRASDPVQAEVVNLPDSGDIGADLLDLARRQLAAVMQPELLRLRRLVIAEAGRFPELGRIFYDQGPGRTIAALTAAFEGLAAQGVLTVADPRVAAAQFNWLIMSEPLNTAMLLGNDQPPDPAELHRVAAAGVETFLAAYGRTPDVRSRSPER